VNILGETLKTITSEELKQFDGKDGKPAYIAFKGKIYDITQSKLWTDGDHMGMHAAGKDLTEEIDFAPHGEETLGRVKLVGNLS
jgi:predicted heme/steroid binding protein